MAGSSLAPARRCDGPSGGREPAQPPAARPARRPGPVRATSSLACVTEHPADWVPVTSQTAETGPTRPGGKTLRYLCRYVDESGGPVKVPATLEAFSAPAAEDTSGSVPCSLCTSKQAAHPLRPVATVILGSKWPLHGQAGCAPAQACGNGDTRKQMAFPRASRLRTRSGLWQP